ncbi:MAG: hypothetical protein JOZ97_08015 [Candidatus Eremiobacteraeota bacterium]|nr:hypothetical protein [Candidatus Eremiobacteraeota bacterium]
MLYKATSFPYEWKPVSILLDRFDACDATIFRFGSLWWLFCTSESFDPNLQLFAFYAHELQGPWKPHRLNPIKTDITSARPAGTPFLSGGELYRPAQDSSLTYGGAVRLNRILRLTPSEFEEVAVKTIHADHFAPYTAGTHTFSYAGSTCVIDAKKRRISFKALPRLLARVWRRPYDPVFAHGS